MNCSISDGLQALAKRFIREHAGVYEDRLDWVQFIRMLAIIFFGILVLNSVQAQTTLAVDTDTYVSIASSVDSRNGTNFGANVNLMTNGEQWTAWGAARTLLKLDHTKIASTAQNIRLRLYGYEGDTRAGYDAKLQVLRLTNDWSGSAVTWDTKPGFDSTVYAEKVIQPTAIVGWHEWDITPLVKAWQRGDFPNYGLMLYSTASGSGGGWRNFVSSDDATRTAFAPHIAWDAVGDATVWGNWNFNDCTANDTSGNGRNGVIHGTTCVAESGGKYLQYDNSHNTGYYDKTDWITLPNFTGSAVNFKARVKWQYANNFKYGWTSIWSVGDASSAPFLTIIANSDLGKIAAYSINSGTTDSFSAEADISDGAWHDVELDSNGITAKLYVDGTLIGSTTAQVAMNFNNAPHYLAFTQWYGGGGSSSRFSGGIDSVSITIPGSESAVGSITPTAARLDVLQKFTLTGTGFTPSTTVAVADCTKDTSYVPSPANTATSITFRCTPTQPGPKTVSVNGAVVAGATVNVDHPVRLGNAGARGIPSVSATSLWNGNVHLEATDLAVPGKGVSFALTRSYNSYDFALEANRGSVSQAAPWRFNWDLNIGYVGTDTSKLWVQREDGSGENFIKDTTDGIWYPVDQGNFNTLKGDTPVVGQTTLLTREGLQYIFQNPVVGGTGGLLVKILDHDGNGLTVARNGSGPVTSVTDASGRVYTFSYYGDSYGLLWKVTDFSGRYVEYTWDTGVTNVRLKTVRDVRGGITTYNYTLKSSTLPENAPTAQFLLSSVVDPRLNTARTFTYTDKVYGNWGADSATDALGNTWSFVYCANQTSSASCSNGATQVDPTGATSFETRVTPPLGAGAATTTRFDTGGRLIAQVDANAKTSKTTPMALAGLTTKTYPLAALATKKQSALGVTGVNGVGYSTVYDYVKDADGKIDKVGNLLSVTDAENAKTQRTWLTGTAMATALAAKNLQRVARFTAATGAEHAFTHTDSGNVQTYTPPGLPAIELIYDPAAAGQVTGVKDGRNNTSTREYDAHGNLLKAIDPVPATGPTLFIKNTYDTLGRVLTSTDKRGAITTNTWDEAGNLKSVKDALNGTVAYDYDANGNRITMTDARLNVTNYTYDKANRLKTVERINGTQTLTTTSKYDVMGRVTSTVNANSHADATTFDPEGNVLALANALADTTSYVYDDDNRVTQTTDPAGRVTNTTYDKVGRVKTVTTTAGTTSYVYDADGRMTKSTDPRGNATQYAYDPAGRLTTLTDANNQITRATYDANGNMLTVVDPNTRTTTYTYDTLNRPLTRVDANGQQWSTTYDENGNVKTQTVPSASGARTTSFTYDALNRVSQVTYPDASTVAYTYDANGNRKTMLDATGTTSYSYDALNRMTSKTDPQGKVVSYAYDGVGNVTTLGYPGGQSVSYTYDAGERLTSLTDWLGKTTTYTLNRAGQVTSALFGNNTRAEMVYDTTGRQTSLINKKADGNVLSSHGLTLDANGNITASTTTLPLQPSLPNVNRAFTYDGANRLATYNGGSVTHDVAGRITTLAGDNYSYNDRDQITAISGTQTASHAYNGEGHRVTRTINGQTTRFVIDPNRGLPEVLAEMDSAGNVLRNYVYGYGLVAQIDSANNAHYYHYDPTGSTLALTNAAGVVSDSYAYTPYGETTASGSTVNPFRYVGKLGVMDDGNGMQYMRARFYRPDVARFMSLDQLAGDVDRPQSLNRYAYALGNPVMGVDPSGNCPWCLGAAIGAAIVVVDTGMVWGLSCRSNTGCASGSEKTEEEWAAQHEAEAKTERLAYFNSLWREKRLADLARDKKLYAAHPHASIWAERGIPGTPKWLATYSVQHSPEKDKEAVWAWERKRRDMAYEATLRAPYRNKESERDHSSFSRDVQKFEKKLDGLKNPPPPVLDWSPVPDEGGCAGAIRG